ncbi:hypothetical protein ACQFX9_29495 [Aliinostoc sp. HNIBRCY26]
MIHFAPSDRFGSGRDYMVVAADISWLVRTLRSIGNLQMNSQ